MDEEIRRLSEEEEVQKKQLMAERKEIRRMRFKKVLNISPLEIIDKADDEDYINVVAENLNKIQLVIDAIDHQWLYQYWSPPSPRLGATTATATATACDSSSRASVCKRQHDDFLHPRDDDDEDMTLISCFTFCNPPRRIKIIIDEGVFATDHTDDHIMSTLLHDVGVLFEHEFLDTCEKLEDVKRTITRLISEAKAHVQREKPKRVRICIQVCGVGKKYYGSAEAATFVAALEAGYMESSLDIDVDFNDYPTNLNDTKRVSRLAREALPSKTIQKEDLQFIGNSNSNSNSNNNKLVVDDDQMIQHSYSYSCAICMNKFCFGLDIITTMPCSHVFHCTCLHDWFRENNTCPLCRYELPYMEVSSELLGAPIE